MDKDKTFENTVDYQLHDLSSSRFAQYFPRLKKKRTSSGVEYAVFVVKKDEDSGVLPNLPPSPPDTELDELSSSSQGFTITGEPEDEEFDFSQFVTPELAVAAQAASQSNHPSIASAAQLPHQTFSDRRNNSAPQYPSLTRQSTRRETSHQNDREPTWASGSEAADIGTILNRRMDAHLRHITQRGSLAQASQPESLSDLVAQLERVQEHNRRTIQAARDEPQQTNSRALPASYDEDDWAARLRQHHERTDLDLENDSDTQQAVHPIGRQARPHRPATPAELEAQTARARDNTQNTSLIQPAHHHGLRNRRRQQQQTTTDRRARLEELMQQHDANASFREWRDSPLAATPPPPPPPPHNPLTPLIDAPPPASPTRHPNFFPIPAPTSHYAAPSQPARTSRPPPMAPCQVSKTYLAPKARFSMHPSRDTLEIKFDPPVSCRYLVLKLWSGRERGNIDVRSVVAWGFAGVRWFPAVELR